jgi:peptidoglycan/LPS O-acetylase OafA/YrhL
LPVPRVALPFEGNKAAEPLPGSNRPSRILLASLLALALLWVLFVYFGAPILIAKAYRGQSLPIFNRMITGQAEHTLTEYVIDWKHSATQASLWLSVLVALLLIAKWANPRDRRGTAAAAGLPLATGRASEFSNLDFLRSVAVLSVLVRHVMLAFGPTPSWGLLGVFGVLLFFVHTSLVLMMSLERIDLSDLALFKTFYIRRLFRIYPLSMACIAIILLFHIPQAPREHWINPDWSTILANSALCQNLFFKASLSGVLWTLPLEVQMYVLLPVFYLLGKKYHIRGLAVLWLAAAAVALIQIPLEQGRVVLHIAARMDIATYVPCFLAGVLSYFIGFGLIRRRFPFIGWPIAMAVGALVLAYATIHGYQRVGKWSMCLIVGVTAPLFAELRMPLLRRPAAWIARYSYGIYLFHLPALWVGVELLRHQLWWIRSSIVLALAFGLPVLLYHLLEAPMIRLGGFLTRRPTGLRGLAAHHPVAASVPGIVT